MEIGRRATAPDMQNALVPGSENSRWYGEWVADDLDTARAVDTCNSLLVRCSARAPAHTSLPRVAVPEQRHAVRFNRGPTLSGTRSSRQPAGVQVMSLATQSLSDCSGIPELNSVRISCLVFARA